VSFVWPLIGVLLPIAALVGWWRLGQDVLRAPAVDPDEDPNEPTGTPPLLFFGYLFAGILLPASARGLFLQVGWSRSDPEWTPAWILIPGTMLVVGIVLMLVCRARVRARSGPVDMVEHR
jgi:hypothetical protein